MSLTIGIIGLPNVGKSSLFNALMKRESALVANYPFATIEPNIGVVSVPDKRLEKLAEWFNPENPPPVVPTSIKFVDIAGLVKGAAGGEGLGNQFLNHIKNASMILEVIRDFEDSEITREHSKNPTYDAETIDAELRIKDIETIEKRLDPIKKEPSKKEEFVFLSSLKDNIAGEKEIYASKTEKREKILSLLKELNLLSLKPKIYAFNTDAEKLSKKNSLPKTHKNSQAIYFSAKTGNGLDDLIKICYETLGLISFITVGEKEARAWDIKKGARAKEASGVIHSDFEKNFIRAKVVSWEKLLSTKSFADARSKGLIRTEGKDYKMKDGDVVEFLVGK